jgi:hypothetical protein
MQWNWKGAADPAKRKASKLRISAAAGRLVVAAGIAAACGRAEGGDRAQDGQSARTGTGGERPALQHRRGQAYAYALPQGWQVVESEHSIEIVARDRITAVAAFFVTDMPGQDSPEEFLRKALQVAGVGNARFVSVQPAPEWPAPGSPWRGIEVVAEAAQDGRPIHMRFVTFVRHGEGGYDGVIVGLQCPSQGWDSVRDWLPHVRDGIRLTRGGVIPGTGTATALPRGRPHNEVYDRLDAAWRTRGVPRADVEQAMREGSMGYVRLQDPQTDRVWELPLEAYDSAAAGYPNPANPDVLLRNTPD